MMHEESLELYPGLQDTGGVWRLCDIICDTDVCGKSHRKSHIGDVCMWKVSQKSPKQNKLTC